MSYARSINMMELLKYCCADLSFPVTNKGNWFNKADAKACFVPASPARFPQPFKVVHRRRTVQMFIEKSSFRVKNLICEEIFSMQMFSLFFFKILARWIVFASQGAKSLPPCNA